MGKSIVLPRVNPERVEQFATLAKTLPIEKPLNFYSFPGKDGGEIVAKDDYPPLYAPWAIDFFFLVGIHQYGFWHGEKRYEEPLYGTLSGERVKGSDLLWKLFLRAFQADPASMRMSKLVNLDLPHWETLMSDDHGVVSLLASKERLELTHAYARSFAGEHLPVRLLPARLVSAIALSGTPAKNLLDDLTNKDTGISGYREDPLKKKALLLMMSLANRPEHFLVPENNFVWDPIVDYHLMRLALRLGLVTLPSQWTSENTGRRFTSPEREKAIRETVFRAIKSVIAQSGRSMAEIDNLMWSARRFCPEVTQPNCARCMLKDACAQKVELFQPVIRTTAY